MSHFSLLVITEQKPDEEQLFKLLSPWDENDEKVTDAKWDWFQLGGRWSGALDPGYDPETDIRNIETCPLCAGTGRRDDSIGKKARAENPSYTCNGCEGKKTRVKWPTQWANDRGNQIQVKDLDPKLELKAFAVLRDGKWIEQGEMGWWGVVSNEKAPDAWEAAFKEAIKDLPPDTWLTIVDCHI